MKYLVAACYRDVEGPTDWPFLEPVCRRLLEDLLRQGRAPVSIQEPFLPLGHGDRDVETQRELASEHCNEYHIAFLHADGKGDPERAFRERIAPVADALPVNAGARIVGVVPVHETEAWMLCDGDALRQALGTRLDDRALGLPQAAGQLEGLEQPKERFKAACAAAYGGRRRRLRRAEPREDLGERVALEALRRLTAFRVFEARLRRALVELDFLPARARDDGASRSAPSIK